MSIRSRNSFLIGSILILSLLITGLFTAGAVSAHTPLQQPTETVDGSAETNHLSVNSATLSRKFYLSIVDSGADLSARKKPTRTPTATATSPAPTATPLQPQATNPAPTATTLPPTATSVAPTATKLPPTAISIAPTATKLPPTATKLPPTATKLPPTATMLPPTATLLPSATPINNPAARQFYVSPAGNDANAGTQNAPWRTIQKAANTASAGDTILIRAGTYKERVLITRSGSATAGYITFMNYPGETPVIDGTGIAITPTAGLVNMSSVSYIKIIGLRVINSDDAAILARRSSYIVVQNNSTQNSHSSGVGIWSCDNVIVDGNKVVDARYVDMAQGGHEESISIVSTTNFEVKNNDVSLQNNSGYLGNEGIDVKESSRNGKVHHNYIHDFPNTGGAIYLDAWAAGLNGTPTLSNIEVYSNVVKNAGNITLGSERGGTVENIKIYNNVVINGPGTGINISDNGKASAPNGNGPRRNIEIYNNTIYKSRWNGGAGIYVVSTNISNISIRNNLVNMSLYNGQIVVAVPSAVGQVSADHNLVFGPKRCSQAFPSCVELSNITNTTVHSNITADPLFVDLNSPNLYLSASSPAINSGVNLAGRGVLLDLNGTARPQGTGYDIGAYEYKGN